MDKYWEWLLQRGLFLLIYRVFQFLPSQEATFEDFDISVAKLPELAGYIGRVFLMSTGTVQYESLVAGKISGRPDFHRPGKTESAGDMSLIIRLLRVVAHHQDIR